MRSVWAVQVRAQPHEVAADRQDGADDFVVVTLGQEADIRAGQAASKGCEDLPPVGELLNPCPRDVGDGGGGDDPIEPAVLRSQIRAVTRDEDGGAPEVGQPFCCLIDEVVVLAAARPRVSGIWRRASPTQDPHRSPIEALVAEVKITGPHTIVPVFRIPQPAPLPATPAQNGAAAALPATTAPQQMVRTMVEPGGAEGNRTPDLLDANLSQHGR
jgi:hypothetical protein